LTKLKVKDLFEPKGAVETGIIKLPLNQLTSWL